MFKVLATFFLNLLFFFFNLKWINFVYFLCYFCFFIFFNYIAFLSIKVFFTFRLNSNIKRRKCCGLKILWIKIANVYILTKIEDHESKIIYLLEEKNKNKENWNKNQKNYCEATQTTKFIYRIYKLSILVEKLIS